MKRIILPLAILIYVAVFASSVRAQEVYDLVVYGGSSAGVASAVQAKRMGHSVAIVCPDVHLGGLSSAGLGATDSGNRDVIGGISREFYHRLWLHYQKPESWNWQSIPQLGMPGQGGRGFDNVTETAWVFEPHVAEAIFEEFVKENDIPVFRGQYLDRMKKDCVEKNGTNIVSIRMKSGEVFRGKTFIDATYEGDLMAAAGVSYTLGRESNEQYGESLNGIQVGHAVSHQFVPMVDPYIVPGKPESGLLPYINEDAGGEDGSADTKIQAYCYRLCMTCVPENRVPFEKPANYDPLNYELFLRSIEAGQRFLMIISGMPNAKTDTNNGGPFSHDFIGQNYDYIDADDADREKICLAHEMWQQGLMWTLQNDPRVPADVQNSYKEWGLAKDEFQDTRHFGHKIYVREGRRMVSDFVLTERHCCRVLPTPRPIGFGSYQMDSHHCQRHVKMIDGKAYAMNEGDVEVSPGGAYPIDFGTILPKRSECTNLLVPVCVSSSHIAYGSIRMEPVFMILGQSAATTACMALDTGTAVQDVNYEQLAARLEADKQVIDYALAPPKVADLSVKNLPGIVCDEDGEGVKLEGNWEFNNVTTPRVGKGYMHDGGTKCGTKRATYTLDVKEAGDYTVRISYPTNPNRAANVPVEVHSADGVKTVLINQKECSEPPFETVGTFRFEAGPAQIVISNKDADGYVILDCVQLLPVKK